MKTWTDHKLTDAQCRVLASFITEEATGRPYEHKHGVAADALHRKGLINRRFGLANPCCVILDAGREALKQARKEGW